MDHPGMTIIAHPKGRLFLPEWEESRIFLEKLREAVSRQDLGSGWGKTNYLIFSDLPVNNK